MTQLSMCFMRVMTYCGWSRTTGTHSTMSYIHVNVPSHITAPHVTLLNIIVELALAAEWARGRILAYWALTSWVRTLGGEPKNFQN